MRRIPHHQEWNVVLIHQNARIRAADFERVTRPINHPATKQPKDKGTQLACSIHNLVIIRVFRLTGSDDGGLTQENKQKSISEINFILQTGFDPDIRNVIFDSPAAYQESDSVRHCK